MVVFQPYKAHHAEAVDNATRTGCSDFNKVEFLAALKGIRRNTFKFRTVQHAFRMTGIVPYNPAVVLDKVAKIEGAIRMERTPEPCHVEEIETPTTERRLRVQGHWLLVNQEAEDFKERLERFVRGSEIQASFTTVANARLQELNAANAARRERQQHARNSLQKGGRLYGQEGRAIKRKKDDDETARTERRAEKKRREALDHTGVPDCDRIR